MDVAYRYLSYRPRSEAELKSHLHRHGFDNECVEKVLIKLKEQGVMGDAAFASFWKDNRDSFSPRGRFLLQQELRQKGIAPDIVAEVLEAVDEDSSAQRAATRKAGALATSDYATFRRKLYSFLRRRGFSYEVTQRVVNKLCQEQEKT